MLRRRTRGGRWGAIVVSLTRGDTLYEVAPDAALRPASTMKLFTSALVLDRLGPDYQFSTDVLREGPVKPGGILDGNLVLRGDGDPSLSNKFFPGDADAPMRALAQQVSAAGIRHVTGDLVGDPSAFESQRIPTGWLSRYLAAGYAARVSALSLNDNLVWVAVTPGVAGHAPTVVLEPSSSAIQIANNVRMVSGSGGARVAIRARPDGVVEARGWVGSRSKTQAIRARGRGPCALLRRRLSRRTARTGYHGRWHDSPRTDAANSHQSDLASLASAG